MRVALAVARRQTDTIVQWSNQVFPQIFLAVEACEAAVFDDGIQVRPFVPFAPLGAQLGEAQSR